MHRKLNPPAQIPRPAKPGTGVDALDAVLDGLFWGENVVWQFDRTSVQPFFAAIAGQSRVFEAMTVLPLGRAVNTYGVPGLGVLDAATDGAPARPRDLMREVSRLCRSPARSLVLLESLDRMVRAWGIHDTVAFVTRCMPLLFDAGVVAYWSMSARNTPAALREAIVDASQCVLQVDRRNVRVAKAEGRDATVAGTVFQWHQEGGLPVLTTPDIVGRVAASIVGVRRARGLSQHDIGDLAGVTASAISQVERAERGLSLATLARLSDAVGLTLDELVHGHGPGTYRIGRRTDHPGDGVRRTQCLLDGPDADVRVDLVHVEPHGAGAPAPGRPGTGILAVASGLLQVRAGEETATLRHGETLVARSDRVAGWSNCGQAPAVAFWIVVGGTGGGA